MNLGFEIVGARDERPDPEELPAQEPMRARERRQGELRRKPTADEKKTKRLRRKKEATKQAATEISVAVENLVAGDLVDLEGDQYAEPGNDQAHSFPYEYAEVDSVEREVPGTILVHFTNTTSIGFPEGHKLTTIRAGSTASKTATVSDEFAHGYVQGYRHGQGTTGPQFPYTSGTDEAEGYKAGFKDAQNGHPNLYAEQAAAYGDAMEEAWRADVGWEGAAADEDPAMIFGASRGKVHASYDHTLDKVASPACPDCGIWGCSPDCSGPEASTICPECGGGAAVRGGETQCNQCGLGYPASGFQDFASQRTAYAYPESVGDPYTLPHRVNESDAEPFLFPSGYNPNPPEVPEAMRGEASMNINQREAAILEAMRTATYADQQHLAVELADLRAQRAASIQAERNLELSDAVISDTLTPVFPHEPHTASTEWLDAVVFESSVENGHLSREMAAQASLWTKNLHEAVLVDDEEFTEQALGKAKMVTSAYGTQRSVAMQSFLDAAVHLRSKRVDAARKTADEYDTPYYPQPGDYVVFDSGSLGAMTSVAIEEEGFLGEFETSEQVDAAIKADMQAKRFWPDVWYMDDHGGMTLRGLASRKRTAAAYAECPSCGASFGGYDARPGDDCQSCGKTLPPKNSSRQAGYGRSYAGDPHWITARYPGSCAKCHTAIGKGDDAFYYPRGKKMFCEKDSCGGAASRDFESASFDEMMMSGSRKQAAQPEWLRERNNDPYGTLPDSTFWDGLDYEDHGSKRIFHKDGGVYGYHLQQNYWMTFSSEEEAQEWAAGPNLDMWASRKQAEGRRTALQTEGPWKAQVAGSGENVWSENAMRFDTKEEAERYAIDLLGRWMGADMARVVPTETPNRETVDPSDPAIIVNWRTGSLHTAEGAPPELKEGDEGVKDCTACDGKGHVPDGEGDIKDCEVCNGSGNAKEGSRRTVGSIPASVSDHSATPEWETSTASDLCKVCGWPVELGSEGWFHENKNPAQWTDKREGSKIANISWDGATFGSGMVRGSNAHCAICGQSMPQGTEAYVRLGDFSETADNDVICRGCALDIERDPEGVYRTWTGASHTFKKEQAVDRKRAAYPVNVGDWSDADWDMHEMEQLANDPDVPKCARCGHKTYDLLPSLKGGGDICMGCARREDQEMRYANRRHAAPSDDLHDVDIEDFEGHEDGPDPDNQSGYAESPADYVEPKNDNAGGKPFADEGWARESARWERVTDDIYGSERDGYHLTAVRDGQTWRWVVGQGRQHVVTAGVARHLDDAQVAAEGWVVRRTAGEHEAPKASEEGTAGEVFERSPGDDAADVAGTPTPGKEVADYPQADTNGETPAEDWPIETPTEAIPSETNKDALLANPVTSAFRRRVQASLREGRV